MDGWIVPLMSVNCINPEAAKQSQTMMFPPPCASQLGRVFGVGVLSHLSTDHCPRTDVEYPYGYLEP